MLTLSQWQFKFFDVTQVKLPDDESAFLTEVRLSRMPILSQSSYPS